MKTKKYFLCSSLGATKQVSDRVSMVGRLHFRSSFEWESAITVINKYYTSTHTKDYQPIIKEIDKTTARSVHSRVYAWFKHCHSPVLNLCIVSKVCTNSYVPDVS